MAARTIKRWLNCHGLSIGGITQFGASNVGFSQDGDEVTDATDNAEYLEFASVQNKVDRVSITVRNIQKVLQSVSIGAHVAWTVIVDGTNGGSDLTVTANATNTVILAPGDRATVPRADLAEGTINLIVLAGGLSVA